MSDNGTGGEQGLPGIPQVSEKASLTAYLRRNMCLRKGNDQRSLQFTSHQYSSPRCQSCKFFSGTGQLGQAGRYECEFDKQKRYG